MYASANVRRLWYTLQFWVAVSNFKQNGAQIQEMFFKSQILNRTVHKYKKCFLMLADRERWGLEKRLGLTWFQSFWDLHHWGWGESQSQSPAAGTPQYTSPSPAVSADQPASHPLKLPLLTNKKKKMYLIWKVNPKSNRNLVQFKHHKSSWVCLLYTSDAADE